MDENQKIKVIDYPEKRVLEIEGIKYAYGLLKALGGPFELGEPFEIVERKDGVLTVHSLK